MGAADVARAVAVGRGRSTWLGAELGLALVARLGVALGVVLEGTAVGPAGSGTASVVRSSIRWPEPPISARAASQRVRGGTEPTARSVRLLGPS